MARKPRVHFPGALYHVMVRGNNGEKVLLDAKHKSRYLSLLALYKEKIGFNLYAFCIMDNHAHFLIEVQDIPLSQIMQRLQQVYTQWFNSVYIRTGHVFQQRYKALLCDKDSYLLQLLRYIHNNPVRANMDNGIEYKWSSHLHYLGKVKGNLVDTSVVLRTFSEDRGEAINQYLQFIDQEQEEIEIVYESCDVLHPRMQAAACEQKKAKTLLTIDELIEKICINENVIIGDIIKRTKIQRISDIRKAIVLLSEKYCDVTNTLLAQKLNLSMSMISKIKSGTCKSTPYMEAVMQKLG